MVSSLTESAHQPHERLTCVFVCSHPSVWTFLPHSSLNRQRSLTSSRCRHPYLPWPQCLPQLWSPSWKTWVTVWAECASIPCHPEWSGWSHNRGCQLLAPGPRLHGVFFFGCAVFLKLLDLKALGRSCAFCSLLSYIWLGISWVSTTCLVPRCI